MDMESQKILFALSTPMEIRNECCLPSHSSPNVFRYTLFDLSSSWELMTVMIYCAQFTE